MRSYRDGMTGTTPIVRAPRRTRAVPIVSLAARLFLVGVFGWAGLSKVSDAQASVRAVRAYRILPEGLVHPFAYALPFFEIGLAVLLLVGIGTRLVALVSALLLLVFIAGVASAWARGLAIDCGCFGGGGQVDPGATRYVQEILRDLGFLAAAVWLVVFPRTWASLDSALDIDDNSLDLDGGRS